jgi:hypothetical protein
MAHRNDHDWAFAAAGLDDTVHAIAICSKCGLIRAEIEQSSNGQERRLSLRGDCPNWEPDQLEERLGQV